MSVVEIEEPSDRSRLCEIVLADLPDWFGFEEVNAAYVRDVAELPTFGVDDDALLPLNEEIHGLWDTDNPCLLMVKRL